MNIRTFHTQTSFLSSTVNFIISLKPQTIALSGGGTPGPVYEKLARNSSATNFPTPAKSVPGDVFSPTFFQVDERYIPRTNPDSNYKLITDCGLKLTHFFDTSLPIEKSLAKYSAELPQKLDLIILGIGEDGHIASIFPCQSPDTPSRDGDKTSDRSDEKVAHTLAPKTSPVKDRLTLTLPYILAAKTILVLLKNKPEILKKLQAAGKSPKATPTKSQIAHFPALALLKHKNCTIYYLKQ